jgi:hypothetical protein
MANWQTGFATDNVPENDLPSDLLITSVAPELAYVPVHVPAIVWFSAGVGEGFGVGDGVLCAFAFAAFEVAVLDEAILDDELDEEALDDEVLEDDVFELLLFTEL